MKLITLFLTLSSYGWAAISANTVWEVRQPSNDTNGGGFVTGAAGTDMSLFDNKNAAGCTSCQSDTINISVTDGVTAGTTTITSATANFSSAIVGNIIYVQGGTGSVVAVWKQVTGFTNSTTITVDSSTGLTTGTGVTINIGGALASPGQAGAIAIAGNYVYIKNGTYTITTASTNVSGGCVSNANAIVWAGYGTTRTPTNTDAKPILQLNSGVSSATILSLGQGASIAVNLELDANTQTSSRAIVNGGYLWRVVIRNSNVAATYTHCVQCEFTGNAVTVLGGDCHFCEFHGNTATPAALTTGLSCISCLSYGNTGASTDGFSVNGGVCNKCVSYSNGRDGFNAAGGGSGATIVNSHAESNTRYGFAASSTITRLLINSSYYGNATADVNGTFIQLGTLTPSGSVFTNAGGADFSLNNTASRGALLRAAGYPATFPAGTTSTYFDVGATQHADPAPSASGGAFGYVK